MGAELPSPVMEVEHDEVHNPSHCLVPLSGCDFHSRGTRGTAPVGAPDSAELPSQDSAAESQDMGEMTPMGGKK